jgi:hypothetical protein
MVAGLFFLSLLPTVVAVFTLSRSVPNDERRGRRIAFRIFLVLLLNAVSVAIFVSVNQLVLNALGFIELPALAAIVSTTLLVCYALLLAVTSRYVSQPTMLRRLKTSSLLLLPLLILGLAFVRYYVLFVTTCSTTAPPPRPLTRDVKPCFGSSSAMTSLALCVAHFGALALL